MVFVFAARAGSWLACAILTLGSSLSPVWITLIYTFAVYWLFKGQRQHSHIMTEILGLRIAIVCSNRNRRQHGIWLDGGHGPTVDGVFCAGYGGGALGRQKCNQIGDLFWFGRAANGDPTQ